MMQLRKIAVRNFRKFVEPVTIDGLGAGINIIAGSNEEGKSTIVQAVKAAFYRKHSTSSTADLQPYNSSVLPEVEVEFDLGGLTYHLRKSFGKKGTADLRSSGCAFSGSDAEDKLQELFSLGSEKKTNSSIWNVLWVEQGTAPLAPEVGEVGKMTLHSALEGELGKIVSGDDGQLLLRRLKDLYSQWFTDTGKHKVSSPYKQVDKQLQELLVEWEKQKTEFESYESTLADVAAVRQLLQQHESDGSIDNAKKRLSAAQTAQKEIAAKADELEKLSAVYTSENATYEKISAEWKTRNQAIQNLLRTQTAIKDITEKLEALRKQCDESATQLHACQQAEEDAEQALKAAEAEYTQAETTARAVQLMSRHQAMVSQLDKARQAETAAAAARTEAQKIRIDKAMLEKLRQTERALFQTETQLAAVATKLEFKPKGNSSVTENGKPVDTSAPINITERTGFSLEGWGDLVVTPGGEKIDEIAQKAASLKQSYTSGLAAAGVATLQEAEEQEQSKANLLRQAEEAERDIRKYAATGIAALAQDIATLASQLEKLQAGCKLSAESSQEAETKLQTARTNRDTCKKRFVEGRAATETTKRKFDDCNDRLKTHTADLKAQEKNAEELSQHLAVLRAEEADDKLAQRMTESGVRAEAAKQRCDEMRQQLQGANPASAASAVAQCQQALDAVLVEVQTLRERSSALAGSLQAFGKTGIAEEFQRTSDKKVQLEETAARLLKRADAMKLAYETLIAAEQSTKSELIQPLMRQLEPYVAEVFEDGKLVFDPASFTVTGLQRASVSEQYQSLSLGTREQLSVLTRMAFAHVLSENKMPAVLILDDALVYSDEQRFHKMQEVLQRAGESFQILVLTCRLRDWSNLTAPTFKLGMTQVAEAGHPVRTPSATSSVQTI